ncbi:MAG: leucine-rich repeat domain-containing protein [Clostridia bacterium]|nr:leucine-rich repeat domain-containing protein [Clostridia bacterium]
MKHFKFLTLLCLLLALVCCLAACSQGANGDGGENGGSGDGDPTGCTHEYTDVVTAPTCTAAGYTTHTCSKCGDVKKDTEVAANGHTYIDTVTAPTCDTDGYTTHTCKNCTNSYKDTIVQMLGHAWDVANATNSSCGCTTCQTNYSWTAPSGFEYDFERYFINNEFVGYKIAGIEGTVPNTLKLPAVYDGMPVMAVGDLALNDIERLMSLEIPDTYIELGDGAFSWCANLSSITLPNTLKYIGSNPFLGTKYYKNACYEVNGRFEYVVRPLIMNGRYLMKGYLKQDQTEYTVPEGIVVIADKAFEDYSQLVTVTLPKTLRYLGTDVFLSCSGLKTINIHKGVVEFGERPYYVVNNRGVLQNVNFEGTQAEWQTIKNSSAFAARYVKYNKQIG